MSDNTAAGAVKTGVGALESGAGRTLGSDHLDAEGRATELEGRAQKAIGAVQDAANQAAEGAKAAVSRAGEHARSLYGQAQDRVRDVSDTVDPFVREQPYAALAVGVAAGLVLGLLLAGRRSPVVYVKPRG